MRRRKRRRKTKAVGAFMRALDLPAESDAHTPRVTLLGREFLLVENHRGVYRCGDELAEFMTELGLLSVRGSELVMAELSDERLCVSGSITLIEYDNTVKRAPLFR